MKEESHPQKFSVKTLTYCAICIALAFALSNVKLFHMPQGGSVTLCSMLFIVLAGYWFGPVAGITTGVAHGLLNLIVDPFVVHPVQLLLDYPLAFGALGLAGFFRHQKYGLYVGAVVGMLGRGFMSFLTGFIFFSEYAAEMNPIIYSLGYNFSYIIPELILSFILVSIPPFRQAIERIQHGKRMK
jgi:thiamine transporter